MLCRCVLCLVVLAAVVAAADPAAETWKYDVIHRKRGLPLAGLVVEQNAGSVLIRCISRRPGSPTVVFLEIVPRAEIARLELLAPEERARLQQRLDALRRERERLAVYLRDLAVGKKGELPGGETVDLRPAVWPGDDKRPALSYRSAYFHLLANTRPALARLAAIHLEQIYAAYARSLPPRAADAAPTTILLTRSLAEYQALARSRGLSLVNPAFYDPARNQVVCGSDLERLSDELEQVRTYHARRRTEAKGRLAELSRVYRGKIPPELTAPFAEAEKKIAATEKRNEETLARLRQRLFQRLYHEAFHAYLGAFVFFEKDHPLPLWFNEGLAQIFETAIVEVGELRVGHADPERLAAVRSAIARGTLLPLADLLRSDHRHFQAAHRSEQHVADRYYLAAWALGFYLRFERKVLGSKAMDDYLAALRRGTDPLLAFRDLVNTPLPAFEQEFVRYLSRLRPDGSNGSPPPP